MPPPKVSPVSARRYRALVIAKRDEWIAAHDGKEHGWKAAVAAELGIKGQYVGMILKGDREAGRDAIDKAVAKLGLASEYFHVHRLGVEPDYRAYLGGGGTRLELDRHPVVQEYVLGHGPMPALVRDVYDAKLRAFGPSSITVGDIIGDVAKHKAADAGRASPARPADAEAVIDEARGQRKAGPRRRR